MHIEHLEALHFRNLERLSVNLHPKTVLVRGQNGQGKTNLLEALYVCATGKSFRNSPPGQLLRHGAEAGHARATFSRQGVRHEVEVKLGTSRRYMRVDDRALRQTSKLLELVNVVAFFPDDLRITKGSPEERRRFIDRAVANHRPEFVDASVKYQKAVRERNAILKTDGPLDRALLEAFDRQLIDHGRVVHRCRDETLAALRPMAQEIFSQLMGAELELGLRLQPGLDISDPAEFDIAFTQQLDQSFARDRARGATNVGPHRADVAMSINERDARAFGSQGQQRAIVLALKLAEVKYLRGSLDSAPMLLLDDVSSELDRERTAMLFEAVMGLESQVWVSTTGVVELPLPDDTQVFDIEAGVVTAAGA